MSYTNKYSRGTIFVLQHKNCSVGSSREPHTFCSRESGWFTPLQSIIQTYLVKSSTNSAILIWLVSGKIEIHRKDK